MAHIQDIKPGQVWIGTDDVPRTVIQVGNHYSKDIILLGFDIEGDLIRGWDAYNINALKPELVQKAGFKKGYWTHYNRLIFYQLTTRKKIILIPRKV